MRGTGAGRQGGKGQGIGHWKAGRVCMTCLQPSPSPSPNPTRPPTQARTHAHPPWPNVNSGPCPSAAAAVAAAACGWGGGGAGAFGLGVALNTCVGTSCGTTKAGRCAVGTAWGVVGAAAAPPPPAPAAAAAPLGEVRGEANAGAASANTEGGMGWGTGWALGAGAGLEGVPPPLVDCMRRLKRSDRLWKLGPAGAAAGRGGGGGMACVRRDDEGGWAGLVRGGENEQGWGGARRVRRAWSTSASARPRALPTRIPRQPIPTCTTPGLHSHPVSCMGQARTRARSHECMHTNTRHQCT